VRAFDRDRAGHDGGRVPPATAPMAKAAARGGRDNSAPAHHRTRSISAHRGPLGAPAFAATLDAHAALVSRERARPVRARGAATLQNARPVCSKRPFFAERIQLTTLRACRARNAIRSRDSNAWSGVGDVVTALRLRPHGPLIDRGRHIVTRDGDHGGAESRKATAFPPPTAPWPNGEWIAATPGDPAFVPRAKGHAAGRDSSARPGAVGGDLGRTHGPVQQTPLFGTVHGRRVPQTPLFGTEHGWRVPKTLLCGTVNPVHHLARHAREERDPKARGSRTTRAILRSSSRSNGHAVRAAPGPASRGRRPRLRSSRGSSTERATSLPRAADDGVSESRRDGKPASLYRIASIETL
jgi:hypothetical protein